MAVRLYVVTDAKTETDYLVAAKNRMAASKYIAHTILMNLRAKPATSVELFRSLANGKPVHGKADDLAAIGIGGEGCSGNGSETKN